ncbi:glycosyltransferase family 2 protein [Candidatus Berkelbacteria bacterium]|nr:glycosyltransferase family 2 protein [Candidatus Berkelbacteria bacterium]
MPVTSPTLPRAVAPIVVVDAPTLAIIIPAYNEAPALPDVLNRLPRSIAGIGAIKTVVVDDGSRDTTAHVASQHGAYVARHRINRGAGLARRTGLAAARRLGATVAVTLDADGQHDPEEMRRLIAPILAGSADVVIGSRLIDPTGMPLIKRAVNRLANLFLRVSWGIRSTDSQSGYRAYNLERAAMMRLKTAGYEADTEILIAAREVGLRVAEVPIRAIYTEYSQRKGQSILNSFTIVIRLVVRAITG